MSYILKSLISLLFVFANEFRVYLDNNVLYSYLKKHIHMSVCVCFVLFF